ncbi:MAG TPA: hypothetical protein VGI73_08350 [Solirubrobacterales bacterium]|jgi:hypothetical protein
MAIVIALLLAGCGSGDSASSVASSPSGATIEGDTDTGREMALEVQRYLLRNCALPGTLPIALREIPRRLRQSRLYRSYKRIIEGQEQMCGRIAAIEVENRRVTIRSDIEPAKEKAAGAAFCNLIAGSDVADEVGGHELQNLAGKTIVRCPPSNL